MYISLSVFTHQQPCSHHLFHTLSINLPKIIYLKTQPQVLWRGSDFDFLPNLRRPMEKRPFDNKIEQTVVERKLQQEYNGNKKKATARGLRAHYDTLLPRWKGTVLTAVSSISSPSFNLRK